MTHGNGHIEIPDDGTCAFCDYLAGRRPYTIVFRDSRAAVLVTREQRGCPHLLVLPIRHAETILTLSDAECVSLMLTVRHAASAIDSEFQRPGIAIWQNNGVPAHQQIGHVHFHVAGTLENGGTDWGDVPESPLATTERIASRLRPRFTPK